MENFYDIGYFDELTVDDLLTFLACVDQLLDREGAPFPRTMEEVVPWQEMGRQANANLSALVKEYSAFDLERLVNAALLVALAWVPLCAERADLEPKDWLDAFRTLFVKASEGDTDARLNDLTFSEGEE
jgi:hypothetical protein